MVVVVGPETGYLAGLRSLTLGCSTLRRPAPAPTAAAALEGMVAARPRSGRADQVLYQILPAAASCRRRVPPGTGGRERALG